MITFSKLGEFGRLGNQLFQYAALRSLSLERGYRCKIPNPRQKTWHGQNCLLECFNIEAEYLEKDEKTLYRYHESNPFQVDENFYYMRDETDLSGFFQSMYYFERHLDQIKKELTPKKPYMIKAKDKINKLKDRYGCEIVSVHIRRGDNTDNTDLSQVALNNFYGTQGTNKLDYNSDYYEYFMKAKSQFTGVKFLIFSGGKRYSDNNIDDLNWCKNSFNGDEFLFSEGNSTIDDFCLIASCDGNILSHVSSFGWWAAFINKNSKLTVAPRNYHPDIKNYTHRYKFYPKNWRLL